MKTMFKKIKFSFFFSLALITCSFLILISCFQAPLPPLKMGYHIWTGYEFFHLAQDLNYYQKQPIELVDYPSATETARALRNGNLELGCLTLDESFLLAESIPDLRVILIIDTSAGADALIAKPELNNLQDLKGKKIGVESSALGAYMFSRTLDFAQLKVEDVNVIPLGFSEHEQAFKSGIIDAVVTFDPVRSNLLKTGAKVLFDSSQIEGEIVDVLVTRQELLNTRQKDIETLVKGWFKALDYFKKYPQESAQIMSEREKVTKEEFLDALKLLKIPTLSENQSILSKQKLDLIKTAEQLNRVLMEKKLLTKKVDSQALLSDQIVKNLSTLNN